MNDTVSFAANPFTLMTSPETIFAALERSDRLSRLKSTICRPLDKPRGEGNGEAASYDRDIESAEIPELFGEDVEAMGASASF